MSIQIQNAVLIDTSGPLEVTALLMAERRVEATGGEPGNWHDREFKDDFAELTTQIEAVLAGYDVDGPGIVKVTEWENSNSDISASARLAVEYHVRARIAKK